MAGSAQNPGARNKIQHGQPCPQAPVRDPEGIRPALCRHHCRSQIGVGHMGHFTGMIAAVNRCDIIRCGDARDRSDTSSGCGVKLNWQKNLFGSRYTKVSTGDARCRGARPVSGAGLCGGLPWNLVSHLSVQ